jgi:outer membrane protein assembly factor BamB
VQRPQRRVPLALVLALVSITVFTACQADWAQWGDGNERQGSSDAETMITTSNVGQLGHRWSRDLGGYINAAPVSGLVQLPDGPRTVVFVGTERGDFYAIDWTGRTIWQRNLGSFVHPVCPDTPGRVYGVSASAVLDSARNAVYAVGGDGHVWALDPVTGATKWRVQWTTIRDTEAVFGAPNLFGNRLYVPVSSHCDTIPYRGRVVDINVDTRTLDHAWYSNGPTGSYGGGIWGWGGVSVDPRDGDVYAITSNSRGEPEDEAFSETMVRLSPDLGLKANHKVGFYMRDDGPGSTPVLFQQSGCPPQLAVYHKHGSVYLYDRDAISAGYRQRIQVIDIPDPTDGFHEPGLIGVPVWYPRTQLLYVLSPTDKADGSYQRGVTAFRLNAECRLEVAWRRPLTISIATTASVMNGVLYVNGGFNGRVYALDAASGAPLWNSGLTKSGAVLAAPIVAAGHLFVGGYDGKLTAWGI